MNLDSSLALNKEQKRMRWWGAGTALFGFLITYLIEGSSQVIPRATLMGIPALALGALGLLLATGLITVAAAAEASSPEPTRLSFWKQKEGEPTWMSPVITFPVAIILLTLGLGLAPNDDSIMMKSWWPVEGIHRHHFCIGTGIVLALFALLFSALRRPALFVFVVASLIILPCLGSYGLWDPWETHYGEVAREILARNDWISLWWAQEEWFWSKPILIFWTEALTMSALGMPYQPDANPANPEWSLRLPLYILSVTAVMCMYAMVQKVWGKRGGIFAAIALATTPYFFMLSHQAITDMPYVSTMIMALAFLGLALATDEGELQSHRSVTCFGKTMVFSGRAVFAFVLSMLSVPQILYLFSRNLTFVWSDEGKGFDVHADTFMSGSAGNGGNPGQLDELPQIPAFIGLGAQPWVQGAIWTLGLIILFLALKKEMRKRPIYMLAFYMCVGLSFMGKSLPGIVLPGAVLFLWLTVRKEWMLWVKGELKPLLGFLTIVVVGMPWYVAMYIRHGQGFTDRLLVHDNINRLTTGVHGDKGTIQYFIEQLGAGLFPWVALVPIAVFFWMRYLFDANADPKKRDVGTMLGIWFSFVFVFFTVMTTKFHHYIFPAVPPAVLLTGIMFHETLGEIKAERKQVWLGTLFLVLGTMLFVLGVASAVGDPRGIVPDTLEGSVARSNYILEHKWPLWVTLVLAFMGIGLFYFSSRLWGAADKASSTAMKWMGFFGAVFLIAVGRDVAWTTTQKPHGYERLIQLFIYQYTRPWSDRYDYRPILVGFWVGFIVLLLLVAFSKTRIAATIGTFVLAVLFSIWALDVYLLDISPHWGQKGVVAKYYKERKSQEEPLIAYQMNWKGENFYTGNRVYIFVDTNNKKLEEWLKNNQGKKAFFMSEQGRMGSLKAVLSAYTIKDETTPLDSNKFALISAVLTPKVSQQLPMLGVPETVK